MRQRGRHPEHTDTVSRRLELLSEELHGLRTGADAGRTAEGDEHTHLRELRPDDGGTPTSTPAGTPTGTPAAPPAAESPQSPPAVPVPGRHAARRRASSLVDLSAFRGRVALGPAHVAVLAVLVALGLGVTAWWVIRDDPGTPLAAPVDGASGAPLVSPAEAASSGATPEADESGEVVVDVTGRVRRPGIVVLPAGSRVADALEAAGGARREADLAGLNQARLLLDGEQIAVGVTPPPGVAATSVPAPEASGADPGGTSTGSLVNLNSASSAELEELPGVGPVTAQAIISWRETNGGFASVDQLLDVDGIGEKTLAQLAPLVTL